MNTKQYLGQIRRLHRSIESDKKEIMRLQDIALSITSSQKDINVQSSGSQDKMGDAISKIVDIQNKIIAQTVKNSQYREKIIADINLLDDDLEVSVLTGRYVDNMTFDEIARENHISTRHAFRTHLKALKDFERIRNLQ